MKIPTNWISLLHKTYKLWFSNSARFYGERLIFGVAILSFATHLLLVVFAERGWLIIEGKNHLLHNPIAAIYTPFSFILIYEVYLLVYYLPQSTSIYIGKQYEIITLIIIRKLFKDLSNLELTANWFQQKYDLQFTYDIIATLALFLLIFVFNRLSAKGNVQKNAPQSFSSSLRQFIRLKKGMALILLPIFTLLAIFSLGNWLFQNFFSISRIVENMSDVNEVFFDTFFTILILADVFILLFSFIHTDLFHKVIRNSGFVISTILLKISFSTEGLLNPVLIISAVSFGVLILWIHNLYDKEKWANHP